MYGGQRTTEEEEEEKEEGVGEWEERKTRMTRNSVIHSISTLNTFAY